MTGIANIPLRIGRRDLLSRAALGIAALAQPRCCASHGAPILRPQDGYALLRYLGPERIRVLACAARAPSSHNTQPWAVQVEEPDRWVISGDSGRGLPVTDPNGRELMLSIGAFLEYLTVAAAEAGWEAAATPSAELGSEGWLVHVRLHPLPGAIRFGATAQIASRRTLRKRYLDRCLERADLDVLLDALGSARWVPRGSPEAERLADFAEAAFEQQTHRDESQHELARWTRLGGREDNAVDGLTPDTMELDWAARLYARHFMDESSVLGGTFRERGIQMVREQAHQGSGWLIINSPDESIPATVDAGRRFARMALLLRERRLAAHPMSQMLEEEPWRSAVGRYLGIDGRPQFVLRMGYVGEYGEPVSPRRPVDAFTTVAG